MKRGNNFKKGFKWDTNGRWKGGIIYRTDGYILENMGTKSKNSKGARYKLQHRIVMEKHLGRKLLRNEIIHHKNANRSDNRIENLQIMTQSEHAKQDYKKTRKINKKGQFI